MLTSAFVFVEWGFVSGFLSPLCISWECHGCVVLFPWPAGGCVHREHLLLGRELGEEMLEDKVLGDGVREEMRLLGMRLRDGIWGKRGRRMEVLVVYLVFWQASPEG